MKTFGHKDNRVGQTIGERKKLDEHKRFVSQKINNIPKKKTSAPAPKAQRTDEQSKFKKTYRSKNSRPYETPVNHLIEKGHVGKTAVSDAQRIAFLDRLIENIPTQQEMLNRRIAKSKATPKAQAIAKGIARKARHPARPASNKVV